MALSTFVAPDLEHQKYIGRSLFFFPPLSFASPVSISFAHGAVILSNVPSGLCSLSAVIVTVSQWRLNMSSLLGTSAARKNSADCPFGYRSLYYLPPKC